MAKATKTLTPKKNPKRKAIAKLAQKLRLSTTPAL